MNALSNATRNELLDEIERLTRERDAAEARIRRWQNEHDVIEERDRLSNQNTKLVAEMAVLQRAHGEALAYGARRTTQLNDTVRENERLTRERDKYTVRAVMELQEANQRLRAAISGWRDHYGWKDGEYIDNVNDIFEPLGGEPDHEALRPADEEDKC